MVYLLCDEVYRRSREGGYHWSEFSWTLADNTAALPMRALVTGATGFLGSASLDLDNEE